MRAGPWLPLVVAASVATGGLFSVPAAAKPPKVTPETAAAALASAELEASGDPGALTAAATESGDPRLFLAAGRAQLEGANDPEGAAVAREPAHTALDILHFIDSGAASRQWQIMLASEVATFISEADTLLQEIDAKIERMEEEARAAAAALAAEGSESRKEKKRERKPGTALIAAGSALSVVGLGGTGMIGAGLVIGSSKQSEVESVDPTDQTAIDALDEQGRRANILAYAGIGVAAVGLGIGIALLAVGVKKRRAGGGGDRMAVVVAPTWGGWVLSGRF